MAPGQTENVPPKQRFPLRLTVPLGLLLFVAVATGWNVRVGREQVVERVQREAIRDVTWTLAGLQADMERAYRVREEEVAQEKISALGAHREYVFAVALDDSNQVLHSMRVGDIGKPFRQVLPAACQGLSLLKPDSLAAIGQALGGRVEASGDGRTVVAAYPLVLGTRGGELRAHRIGSLVAIHDLSALEAEGLRVVTREALRFFYALAIFAAGLGLFFHFRIASRLGRLASVARDVGAGNMDVRSGLRGSDEVAELSWAFDQMVSDKARAEAQTADRQSRLEAILNTATDAIITINERGIIQTANPATENVFGYASSELIGSNIQRLMPAPYAGEHDTYLAAYVETGQRKIIGVGREVEAKRKDGTTFPVDLAVSESDVGGQRLFTGIVRDISERRLVEAEQQSLGRILEDSLNEIYVFDAETLFFIQANKGARENIGYAMDELRSLTPADLKPDFTPQKFAELIEPLRSGEKENVVFETVHCRRDGSRYDVEVHLQLGTFQGSPAFVAMILDTTQRKRAERSLRVQQRALESAVNGIIITDPNQTDNPVVYVNPASLQITGYAEEEVLGRNCRFLQRDDREQEALEEVRAAIEEERGCTVVLRNFRKDGTPFWNELTISPVRDENGLLTHFVGIQSDITARREAEEALARVNQELEKRVRERTRQLEEAQELLIRKEKLATLGQLAAGVAHEIRNPMGVIRNASYFLEQTLADGDEDTRECWVRFREVSQIQNESSVSCSTMPASPKQKRVRFPWIRRSTRRCRWCACRPRSASNAGIQLPYVPTVIAGKSNGYLPI